MRLSKIAILALRGLGRDKRKSMAEEMGITEDALYRYIRKNDDCLTKFALLNVIRRELGLDDSELLESEVKGTAA